MSKKIIEFPKTKMIVEPTIQESDDMPIEVEIILKELLEPYRKNF